ncbi:MAG: DUF1573 domain-containing protein [Planctomycetaceae bacterium]|nr:DUF1573 domain-containing protein [Planctomycetaceae bacterium]
MNIRAVAIVVFLVLTGGGLAMHFRQQSMSEREQPLKPADAAEIPKPPKSGPYGKFVVAGDPVHNFGVMEHMQEGQHEFKVRNDGQAPLKMVALKADQTCQCTLGSLGQDGLKPGEETIVKLSWTIKNPAKLFEHSAKIRTDDPENPVTTFRVRGLVGQRLVIKPSQEINLGLLSEKEPTERSMLLFSEIVDAFEITKFEPTNPLIVTTATPMTAEQLKLVTHDPQAEASRAMLENQAAEFRKHESKDKPQEHTESSHEHPKVLLESESPGAKCGYELKVTFLPGFPIGKLRETLQIFTNVPHGLHADASVSPPMRVSFTGSRSGPVQILAGSKDILWSPEESVLRLGRFPVKDGKKAKLVVFVKKMEQELEITEAKLDPPLLKYEFRKVEPFDAPGRNKYEIVVEVPAGGIPLSLGGGDRAGTVVLQTNHPEAKTIKFDVEFTSF